MYNLISTICTFASAVFFLLPIIVHCGLIPRAHQEVQFQQPTDRRMTDMSPDFHLNHKHTRSGRCFFTSPSSSSPNTWSEEGGPDVFDIDPRFNQYQLAVQQPKLLNLPAPIAYQILHRSSDHLALSPVTHFSFSGDNRQEP